LSSSSLRVVFAGSPLAAVPSLRQLAASRHSILATVTREPSPVGRRGTLTETPVAEAARELGIPLIEADRFTADASAAVTALAPDLGVIVAYGALVKEPLLSTPRLGWINLHFSLLPRWRGAAPVQRAIIAGDTVTGASVFQLVPELDAGEVFASVSEPIGRLQTAGHLLETLAIVGAKVLVSVVDALADGIATATPQFGEVTFAPKLHLEDGRVDWNQPAELIANLIRGVTPEPGAFTTVDGVRLKIIQAAIAHGAPRLAPGKFASSGSSVLVGSSSVPIELVRVLPAGRTTMAASDWWRGRPVGSATVAE
jgi:methionyl-tRNA formyltransferase